MYIFLVAGRFSNSMSTYLESLDAEANALEVAETNNWLQNEDSASMDEWIQEAIARYPEKVLEYKGGKTGLIGLFMGEVMKLSQGKADPKKANQLMRDALHKI